LTRCGQVTGPLPELRSFNHPGSHGIQDNISAYFQKMAVFLDQYRLVATLKQVSVPAVIFVEELRVDTIELPHAEGQIAFRRLDEKVVMVGHEGIGVTDPIIPFVDMLKGIQKNFPVMIIFKDRFLLIPAGSDMVDCTCVFYAERA
jgi:hypothetical protein